MELSRVNIKIHSIDYLASSDTAARNFNTVPLKFQQDCFRLWYQVDGTGILQNVTRKSFGTARPGLLGVMGRGERHSYLHQKGNFECFQILFSLNPSTTAKCYWNTEIEGKLNLDENYRLFFENLVFDLLFVISSKREILGLATISRLLEILVILFKKNLLLIEESQFPKNKAKSLIAKAKIFMDTNYASMKHQHQLEKECGVDINYLNILFKKETGKTLYQYIRDVRMEYAKHFLETGDDQVNDIARKIGYPNSNSFTRAFKKVCGLTPQEFRLSSQK
ncbi:Transcriptional regulator, AraC family [Chitinispirillum alkaliphilum]|nr:Transcriptional regulator, AraC family [Chitinispirillum alkaliphilum]